MPHDPWLSLDFETFSDMPLPKTGVYRYVESPHTGVWCAAWAIDDEPVQVWRKGEPCPPEIVEHVEKGRRVRAWNAQFERIVWNGVLHRRAGWPKLKQEQVWCTQAQALTLGLPMALDRCAEALGLKVRVAKDKRRRILKLCKPRLINADGSILWWDDENEQRLLAADCLRDVEIERAIAKRLRPIPPAERKVYLFDQRVNDRGIKVDLELVNAGIGMVQQVAKNLDADVKRLTSGMAENTRKRQGLLNWLWLHGDQDCDVDSIDKHTVARLLKNDQLDDAVKTVLTIRREAARSSTAKLKALVKATGGDGRIRGTLQYYGARQTGRWAGRLIQPQNLPRGSIKAQDLEGIVADVKRGDAELVDILHGPPLDVIASTLRGCLVAAPGKDLVVIDFAAIEARILAWLAEERDLLHQFRERIDPYKVMASRIYHATVEAITDTQRFLGKTVVLACGYQLGAKALRDRLAISGVDVDMDFAEHVIDTYRYANSAIRDFWFAMDTAAKNAIRNPGTLYSNGKITFGVKGGILYMRLPSGRFLAYLRPSIGEVTTENEDGSEWTREQIFYWGVDAVTYRWAKLFTYGGKLTENAVQAIARDALVAAMLKAEAAGYPIVLHVHDEIVAEVPEGWGSVDELAALASDLPGWLDGCPIRAEGWRGPRYRKA